MVVYLAACMGDLSAHLRMHDSVRGPQETCFHSSGERHDPTHSSNKGAGSGREMP